MTGIIFDARFRGRSTTTEMVLVNVQTKIYKVENRDECRDRLFRASISESHAASFPIKFNQSAGHAYLDTF